MLRSLSAVGCALVLAGCSGSSDLMRTATPTVPLQFESEPAGAEVKTSSGQTCRTPCALAVPAADMQVTYSLNGFQPQTVPVKLMPPDNMRGNEEIGLTFQTPRMSPSPVYAELQRAAPRRAPAKKPRVARQPQAQPEMVDEPPAQRAQPQQQQQRTDTRAAPQPSTSGFNPPPQQNGGFGAPPQQQAPAGAWPAPPTTR